jgi:uncharacterized DUF497 family protein
MRIFEIIWPKDRIDHIGFHGINPQEVEEVCFRKSLVLRTKQQGLNPVYYVLGQTSQGRYLLCIIIQFPEGKGYPVTAREMTEGEKTRFKKWRKP